MSWYFAGIRGGSTKLRLLTRNQIREDVGQNWKEDIINTGRVHTEFNMCLCRAKKLTEQIYNKFEARYY